MRKKCGGRDQKPFEFIVKSLAAENASRLISRARTANRLAKSLHGRSRQNAYAVKHDALLGLHRRFPRRVELVSDHRAPHLVVVTVPQHHFGLHAPAQLFNRVSQN